MLTLITDKISAVSFIKRFTELFHPSKRMIKLVRIGLGNFVFFSNPYYNFKKVVILTF